MHLRDFDEGWIVHGLAVPQTSVRLEYHALFSKVFNGVLAIEEGIDFDLVDGGFGRDAVFDEFGVVLDGVVGDANVADLACRLEAFEGLVGVNVLSGYRPVD